MFLFGLTDDVKSQNSGVFMTKDDLVMSRYLTAIFRLVNLLSLSRVVQQGLVVSVWIELINPSMTHLANPNSEGIHWH